MPGPVEVREIFVAIATSAAGVEGVVAGESDIGRVPLYCETRDALDAVKLVAQAVASDKGELVEVYRFERSRIEGSYQP